MRDEEDAPGDQAHPLDRLTRGGWRKGVLRLALGLGVVGMVLYLSGEKAWAPLLERRMLPYLVAGALIHLVQRAARVRKWQLMITRANLLARPFRYLMRVQLVGLLVNLLLPVSDALKAWAVARDRGQLVVAAKSLIADIALHTAFVGAAGVAALVVLPPGPWIAYAAAAAFGLGGVIVLVVMQASTKDRGARLVLLEPRVLGWCLVETVCQIATYGLAFHAVGLDLGPLVIAGLAPLLYVSDMVMVTPQGIGAREAVFAAAAAVLPGATGATVGVTMGLSITSMLLVAALVGGSVGLLLPDGERS
ncbi:MAG: flippase-like domain-containing protein [Myxococcales bacterium]|nr:flippase-like domain-containing protein [Myxococcales bacterium]